MFGSSTQNRCHPDTDQHCASQDANQSSQSIGGIEFRIGSDTVAEQKDSHGAYPPTTQLMIRQGINLLSNTLHAHGKSHGTESTH